MKKQFYVILLILLMVSMLSPFSYADDVEGVVSTPSDVVNQPSDSGNTPSDTGSEPSDTVDDDKPDLDPSENTQQATLSLSYELTFLGSYYINGIIKEDVSDATLIMPYYSLNDQEYYPVESAYSWEPDFNTIMYPNTVPYMQYLNCEIDKFYVKLLITGGKYAGFTTTCKVEKGEVLPLPENYSFYTMYPYQNQITSGWKTENVYNITIKEGTTNEELLKVLPASIKPKIQILEKVWSDIDNMYIEEYATSISNIDYLLSWNLNQGVDVSTLKENSMEYVGLATCSPPIDSTGTAIIDLKHYCFNLPPLLEPLKLQITVVSKGYVPKITLDDKGRFDVNLFYYLDVKPAGAEKLTVQYSMDGGGTWIDNPQPTSVTDTLLNQEKQGLTLSCGFDNGQSPMKEYLAGQLEGFLVRLKIDGGPFTGYSQTTTWPSGVTIAPPPTEDDGAGGNRGDTGSNTGDGSGDRFDPEIPLEPILPPDNVTPPEAIAPGDEGDEVIDIGKEENQISDRENLDAPKQIQKDSLSQRPDKLSGRQSTSTIELPKAETVFAEDSVTDKNPNKENPSTAIIRQNRNNWLMISVIISALIVGISALIVKILKEKKSRS